MMIRRLFGVSDHYVWQLSLCIALLAFVPPLAAQNRLPAVPLIAHNPYFTHNI